MTKKVKIIGVPMDLGAGRRGVDMGPSVIRIAGLNQSIRRLGFEVIDAGNVNIQPPESMKSANTRAYYLPEISAACKELATTVEQTLEEGAFPVVIGGDHSIAIGSVAGLASFYRKRDQRVGIIWLDAHTDINTPDSTPSGNVHGMPLAVLLGHGLPELTEIGGFSPKVYPESTVIIGARSVDPGEVELIRALGIRVYTMSDVDERGIGPIMEEAIAIASTNTVGFHATLDMDFLDPYYAPGVGTREMGGCIIRAQFLGKIKEAYDRNPQLSNLLLDAEFQRWVIEAQSRWRKAISISATVGVPVLAMSGSLGYFDSYRSAKLPQNLTQAQRDFFGAHLYERIDSPDAGFIHTNWEDEVAKIGRPVS